MSHKVLIEATSKYVFPTPRQPYSSASSERPFIRILIGHTTLPTESCLKSNCLIPTQDVCNGIHRSLAPNFRYGLVWGKSSKFNPHAQKVSLNHQVADEDVVSSGFPPSCICHLRCSRYIDALHLTVFTK